MRQPYRARRAATETSEVLMTKPVLTVEEVSRLFGLAPHVIRRAVREHELPAEVRGHDICGIRRQDLLAWLERRGGV
jgi:excisionase family DNA binding protein